MSDATLLPGESLDGLHPLGSEGPLNLSPLWDLQSAFYAASSVAAWTDAVVPNFVTSNAFIAASYARVIAGAMRDWVTKYVRPSLYSPHLALM
jgi:hypothetical protein